MDQIGTSHIATADLIIFGGAIALIIILGRLPATSKLSIVLAVVLGCGVLAIIGSIFLIGENLNRNAVLLLAVTAFYMCTSIGDWSQRRRSLNKKSGLY